MLGVDPVSAPVIYLDSNVFIDAIEREPTVAESLKRLFLAMEGRQGVAATSELTLAEVLAPSKQFGPRSPMLRRVYLQLMAWNAAIALRPITRSVLYETVELRKFTRHKLPDAIHCVTAVQAGCRYLISADQDMRDLPSNIVSLNGRDGGIDHALEAINA
jgi:predicted nucleic acid-binding protein